MRTAVESHHLTGYFDDFLEAVCNIQKLEKEGVFKECLHTWLKSWGRLMGASATRVRELYDAENSYYGTLRYASQTANVWKGEFDVLDFKWYDRATSKE
jgi:hypothetical protein